MAAAACKSFINSSNKVPLLGGTSFTGRELLIRMPEMLESTLWTSLRMMEDRRSLLLLRLAKKTRRGVTAPTPKLHLDNGKEMNVQLPT